MNNPSVNSNKSKHHSYTSLGRIGYGNFGEVFLVQSSLDQRHYVLKKIRLQNRSQESKQQILKEIKVMQQLHHCYVIRYVQSFVREKSVCIVMEHAEKGDLEKYLEVRKKEQQPLSEEQIIQWFIQLLLGLKYIHEKKIVHRDLKPDNIFISIDNELQIGDFGISKLMTETFDMAKTKIGTPFVMAPQIWDNMKYNQKSDIWSLGCVLYKMMALHYPFQADNSGALIAKILQKKIPPLPNNYSQDLINLVHQMLQVSAQKRPSVHKILEKPFIRQQLNKTLEKTINLCDQNYNSNQSLKKSASINRLFKKQSSSSLSHLTTNHQSGQEHLRMIEYKQNYPMLLQENRVLKEQLASRQKEKDELEDKSQLMLARWRESDLSREDLVSEFQQHILNYLYP